MIAQLRNVMSCQNYEVDQGAKKQKAKSISLIIEGETARIISKCQMP